jgi:hypothetical protein
MAAVERIIESLKRRKVSEAMEGLIHPQTKDAFELGRLCGIQQGLAIAEQLVHEAIGEDEQDEQQPVVRRRAR